jgi:hypothetical protein
MVPGGVKAATFFSQYLEDTFYFALASRKYTHVYTIKRCIYYLFTRVFLIGVTERFASAIARASAFLLRILGAPVPGAFAPGKFLVLERV